MSNIYYHPEEYGLVTVASIEYSSGSYEFDTRVVWKDINTGELFTARDSGCSCPTPFETYDRFNIDKFHYPSIYNECMSEANSDCGWVSIGDVQAFLETLRNVMQNM